MRGLKLLTALGLIEEKRFGRIRVYRFRESSVEDHGVSEFVSCIVRSLDVFF